MLRSFLVVCLVVCVGCRPEQLQHTLPPDVRVDTYLQQGAAKVDVLWVVDNSGSMAPRQEILARNFSAFIDLFTKGSIDYRLAITTTDIFKDQGQFKGTPKILSPSTPNVVSTFATNVRVGTSGSPFEAGLQAAQMSLDRQTATNQPLLDGVATCNAGCGTNSDPNACLDACSSRYKVDFLRPDAYLYLVFVSDEDDKSTQDIRYFWRYFETIKGVGNDGTVTTAAIIGVAAPGCDAVPGARYQGLSTLTGGEVGSVCDADFAVTLKKLATNAVGLKRKFALGKPPNEATIKISIVYPCNVSDEGVKPCASVDRAKCANQPSDAMGAVCTPQQGGPDGWSYEPTNRLIYFSGDSVPGLHSEVDIQYYEEGKGP